jgi:hypothetical protein
MYVQIRQLILQDKDEEGNDEIPWQSWLSIMEEDYDELYKHLLSILKTLKNVIVQANIR